VTPAPAPKPKAKAAPKVATSTEPEVGSITKTADGKDKVYHGGGIFIIDN